MARAHGRARWTVFRGILRLDGMLARVLPGSTVLVTGGPELGRRARRHFSMRRAAGASALFRSRSHRSNCPEHALIGIIRALVG
jgi:hypothetical protein